MRNRIILKFVGQLYQEFLRDLIVKQVEETDSEADDMIIGVLDLMFGYYPPFKKGGENG